MGFRYFQGVVEKFSGGGGLRNFGRGVEKFFGGVEKLFSGGGGG